MLPRQEAGLRNYERNGIDKMKKINLKYMVVTAVSAAFILTGCGQGMGKMVTDPVNSIVSGTALASGALSSEETSVYTDSRDGGHAITADGIEAQYKNASVTKTGDSEGDEADFYGENSAVYATNGAKLALSGMEITTDGTHANAVFSYGEGTEVEISNSTIETSGNCSGGIMTTGGGTMKASDLNIHTTGRSSAAIRSDRGGGTVTVNGGSYTTEGVGSPAIYSTADITVNDAVLTSKASQGVVVEGKNSVSLNNTVLNADNNTHNSDKSDRFQAVMIYQSMSGDADEGLARFSANGGSIVNSNGDIFFVNNTATDISLTGVDIENKGDGVFLYAAKAGWGNEGSNGGKVNLTASNQKIDGDMIVDDISVLNLYLKDGSEFTGAVNPDGAAGDVYVELKNGSKWVLSGNSNITSLTCDEDSIDLNGYTLTVNGETYTQGKRSSGTAIEIKSEGGGKTGGMPAPPDGERQAPPDGKGQPPQGKGTPLSRKPEKPIP